ncbi:hypothetical protein BH23BAC4_BH23BAC4_13700 [soil metagenome]
MPVADPILPLALLEIDGLGQVSANRITDRCNSVSAIRAAPREQLIIWLKSVPGAAKIAARLQEGEELDRAMDRAREEVRATESRGIKVLTRFSAAWPRSLAAMPHADRPVALYVYGHVELLSRPSLAILGSAPHSDEAFTSAQTIGSMAHTAGFPIVCGAVQGFDVPFHRRAASERKPLIMVAAVGLGKIESSLRPAISGAINGGGLLISPFSMNHGPFDHDIGHAMKVMAGLAAGVVATEFELHPHISAAVEASTGLKPVLQIPSTGLSRDDLESFLAEVANTSQS